jgi:tetratricopeptide (TPR) repeat protein
VLSLCTWTIALLAAAQDDGFDEALRLAARAATERNAELYEKALELCGQPIAAPREAQRWELRARSGRAIAELLGAAPDSASPRVVTRRRLALWHAREALRALGPARAAELTEVELALLPLLAEERRFLELATLCEQALRENPPEQTARPLRAYHGIALLEMGKVEKARALLEDYLALDPQNLRHALGLIDRLPQPLDGDALLWLRPFVAAMPPSADSERATWKLALERFYALATRAPKQGEPLRAWIPAATTEVPMPEIWRERGAAAGFRTYRPPNTVAGKTYAGKKALQILRPLSGAWKECTVPEELWRWGFVLAALRRGADGPLLVVYGYGPDLDFWYGHGSEERGVTGKSARGDNRGGIEGLVADFAYGDDAKRRGIVYQKTRPLAFAPPLRGASRRAWRADVQHFDETFVAFGQVTIELLLCAKIDELALYEAELKALYAGLRER